MALIKCPECGGTVSSFADKCPHCGRPMEAVKVARKAKTKAVTEPQPEVQPEPQVVPEPVMEYQPIEEPVSEPQVQIAPEVAPQPTQVLPQLTSPVWNGVSFMAKSMMVLMSIACIVLFSIIIASVTGNHDISRDFVSGVFGFGFSFVALYFLSRSITKNTSILQKILGVVISGILIFAEVSVYKIKFFTDIPVIDDYFYAFLSVFIIAPLLVMLYAGTVKNYTKYIMLLAGAVFAVGLYFSFGPIIQKSVKTTIYVLCGVGLMAMLVGWIVEAMSAQNKLAERIIAIIEILLVLTTVVFGTIMIMNIINFDVETSLRFRNLKLAMIFMMISGGSSLLLSLALPRKRFLFIASAVFTATALLITLNYYQEFYIALHLNPYIEYCDGVYSWSGSQPDFENALAYVRHLSWCLVYAGALALPISIMMSYVAEMTKGLTNKISHK